MSKPNTTQLSESVSVKVADSRKVITVYGLFGRDTIASNFTLEGMERLIEVFPKLQEFFEANRDKLLSADERKNVNKAKRVEEKILSRKRDEVISCIAVELVKANPKMTWDAAMAIATDRLEKQEAADQAATG